MVEDRVRGVAERARVVEKGRMKRRGGRKTPAISGRVPPRVGQAAQREPARRWWSSPRRHVYGVGIGAREEDRSHPHVFVFLCCFPLSLSLSRSSTNLTTFILGRKDEQTMRSVTLLTEPNCLGEAFLV